MRLPNNLAIGFSLVLGGSLLCVLPFGFTQGAGISLITSGIVIAAQGAAQGEKPYFINSETGQRLPYNHPNSGPSIGAGTNF